MLDAVVVVLQHEHAVEVAPKRNRVLGETRQLRRSREGDDCVVRSKTSTSVTERSSSSRRNLVEIGLSSSRTVAKLRSERTKKAQLCTKKTENKS